MSTSKQRKEGKSKSSEEFLFKRPTTDELEEDWLHMRTRINSPEVAKAITFYSHLYNKFRIPLCRYAVKLLEELAISGGGGKGRAEAVEILVAQAMRKQETQRRIEEAEFDERYREIKDEEES